MANFFDTLMSMRQDPQAINQQFGVPNQDVNLARAGALQNLSLQLLAMGQEMTPDARARMMANLKSPIGGYMDSLNSARQNQMLKTKMQQEQQEQMRATLGRQELEQQIRTKMEANPADPYARRALGFIAAGDMKAAADALYPAPSGGYMMSPEQKASYGFQPTDPIWVDNATGKPTMVGGRGSNVTINQGKPWSEYSQKQYESIMSGAANAGQLNAELQTFGALMSEGAATGWAEPWKMKVKQVTGLDLGSVAGQEALQSVSNRIVAPMVKQLGQNPTDRDLQFIVDSTPRLGATPQGNKLMMEAIRTSNDRKIAMAGFVQEYMQRNAEAFKADPFQAQLGLDRAMFEFAASKPEIFADSTARLRRMYQEILGGGQGGAGTPGVRTTSGGVPYVIPGAN